jgi:hypothetical protein
LSRSATAFGPFRPFAAAQKVLPTQG